MFPIDHTNLMVGGLPSNSKPEAWVKEGAGYDPIRQGAMFGYVNTVDAYRCPSDYSKNERSISITGTMRGENWNKHLTAPNDTWAMWGTDRIDQIKSMNDQLIMLEELDNRGWNVGSWIMYVGNAQKWNWIDYMPTFHGEGTNLGFADGHVNFYACKDKDTIFASHNETFFLYDPNNEDWTYMRNVYRQLPSYPNVP